MTQGQFHVAEQAWARGILAQPAYTMPNGRSSHDVARDVFDDAADALIDHTQYTAYGRAVVL